MDQLVPSSLDNLSLLVTDSDGRFSITVPATWTVDSSAHQGVQLLVLEPLPVEGFRANINVRVQPLGALTTDEYLNLSRLQVKHFTGRDEPDVDKPSAHHKDGRLLEWHAPIGAFHVKVRQLVVVSPPYVYVVSATAVYIRFSEYRQQFQEALDSFRLVEQGANRDPGTS